MRILIVERDRLILWTPVCLAVGIGLYFSLLKEPPLWAGPLALALSACARIGFSKNPLVRALAMALLLAALGFSLIAIRTHVLSAPALYSSMYYRGLEGTIEDIQEKEGGEKLVLGHLAIADISPRTTPLHATLGLKDKQEGLAIGDRIHADAMLMPPPSPSMPGSYDFARDYYYQQIGAVGYTPKPVVVLEHGQPSSWDVWLNDLRLSINDRIIANMSQENGPIASAMMVGEMSAVSTDVRNSMRDAGIYHVLSISGLHMSIAAGLLYFSVRLLLSLFPALALRFPVKKLAALLGLLGSWVYLMLAGYPVPAIRSFMMVACIMLAVLFDRRGISIYSLAWAATLILLLQPESLLGSSFQLSFAATLAILALYERYSSVLHKPGMGALHRVWMYFFGVMMTSLVATLATTPLVIYHFNRFTLWGIIANMLMMPLASVWIMPAAIAAFLAMPLGLEKWPLELLDVGISWMMMGARWIASMPYASVAMTPLTFSGMLLTVFGGLWLALMSGRWRLAGAGAFLLGMCSMALHMPYDMMISGDGKKVAVRMDDGQFALLRGRTTGYDAQVWLRHHGQSEMLAATDLTDDRQCEGNWCITQWHGKRIAVGKNKFASDSVCSVKADIIISERYVDDKACQPSALVIDRKFLYKTGAIALRFTDKGMQLSAAEDVRRDRPWSSEAHYRQMHAKFADSPLYDSDNESITNP